MIIDYCPNCGDKERVEKIDDSTIYCPKCDETFKVEKGKTRVEKVGRLKSIEDRLDKIESDGKHIKKDLYDDEEIF